MSPFTEDAKPQPVYNLSYFIEKFQAIPESRWTEAQFKDPTSGASCALGHCGVHDDTPEISWSVEGRALVEIAPDIMDANDGLIRDADCSRRYPSDWSPKKRVLTYLKDLKGG